MLRLTALPTKAPLLLCGDYASCEHDIKTIREVASELGFTSLVLTRSQAIVNPSVLSECAVLGFLGWTARREEVDFVRQFRRQCPHTPILIVAACQDPEAKAMAFSIGADNFLDPGFLKAELKAKARRLKAMASQVALKSPISIGDVQIWPDERVVLQSGRPVQLSQKELAMLICLARRSPEPTSREHLEREAFGLRHAPGTNVVAVHIHRLRKKFEASGDLLQTVPGEGYRLG